MRQYFVILISLLIFSCATENKTKDDVVKETSKFIEKRIDRPENIKDSIKTKDNVVKEASKFVGEKIDGPANIRDSINGNLIFELNDNVQVEATDFKDKWCQIGLFVKLSNTEYENGEIEKEKQLLNSKEEIIGKTLAKVVTWTDVSDKNGNYGYIAGLTHKKNIKKESLLENDLLEYLKTHKRDQNDFTSFIKRHGLEKDDRFLNFEGLYISENWITDPSPGHRICLLFQNHKLQGVFHSRSLNIPNTTLHKLTRGYKVVFFNDYPQSKQLEYVNFMSEWLNGVD